MSFAIGYVSSTYHAVMRAIRILRSSPPHTLGYHVGNVLCRGSIRGVKWHDSVNHQALCMSGSFSRMSGYVAEKRRKSGLGPRQASHAEVCPLLLSLALRSMISATSSSISPHPGLTSSWLLGLRKCFRRNEPNRASPAHETSMHEFPVGLAGGIRGHVTPSCFSADPEETVYKSVWSSRGRVSPSIDIWLCHLVSSSCLSSCPRRALLLASTVTVTPAWWTRRSRPPTMWRACPILSPLIISRCWVLHRTMRIST